MTEILVEAFAELSLAQVQIVLLLQTAFAVALSDVRGTAEVLVEEAVEVLCNRSIASRQPSQPRYAADLPGAELHVSLARLCFLQAVGSTSAVGCLLYSDQQHFHVMCLRKLCPQLMADFVYDHFADHHHVQLVG